MAPPGVHRNLTSRLAVLLTTAITGVGVAAAVGGFGEARVAVIVAGGVIEAVVVVAVGIGV